MRTTILALLLALAPATLSAQTTTTGTLSPNTTVVQAQTPTVPTTATPPTAATAATPPAPRDAAIFVCAEDFSTGRLVVTSGSASAGGPTIPPGTPCAQALSDLFVAGFGVIDVLPLNDRVQYTLVR